MTSVREIAHELTNAISQGCQPRVHPNGFIQLDLGMREMPFGVVHGGARQRLHVWPLSPDDVVRQATRSPLHDHIFDMESEVIGGRMVQERYEVAVEHGGEPTHEIHVASYRGPNDTVLRPSGVLVRTRLHSVEPVTAGSTYTQPAYTFHNSNADPLTVTVMTKTKRYDGGARVLCPVGEEPDNDFSRHDNDVDLLWDIIFQALTGAARERG